MRKIKVKVKILTDKGWLIESLDEGSKLKHLISRLAGKYGKHYDLIDEEGRVSSDVVIIRNGLTTVDANEVLSDGDTIYILQPYAGG